RAGSPHRRATTERLDQRRGEVEGQALVAVGVVVRAHVLVAGMADDDRAGHELERAPPDAVPEAAPPDVAQRVAGVALDERLVVRPDGATVVAHRDRSTAEYGRCRHRGATLAA